MRVVASYAFHFAMRACQVFVVLLVMFDETTAGVNFFYITAPVALTTLFRIAVDLHLNTLGV